MALTDEQKKRAKKLRDYDISTANAARQRQLSRDMYGITGGQRLSDRYTDEEVAAQTPTAPRPAAPRTPTPAGIGRSSGSRSVPSFPPLYSRYTEEERNTLDEGVDAYLLLRQMADEAPVLPNSGAELARNLIENGIIAAPSKKTPGYMASQVEDASAALRNKWTGRQAGAFPNPADVAKQVKPGDIISEELVEKDTYNLWRGLVGTADRGLSTAATGIAETGALLEDIVLSPIDLLSGDKFGTAADGGPLNAIADALRAERDAKKAYYAENTAKGGKAAEIAEELLVGTWAAVPQALAAMLTGGASMTSAGLSDAAYVAINPGVANTVSTVISQMARDPNYWMAFSQVAGDNYYTALEDGADPEIAAMYAIGNGLINAYIEVGGGIQTLPDELQSSENWLKTLLKSAHEEGMEEVPQGIIERALQGLIYNKNVPVAAMTDETAVLNPYTIAQEYAGGVVVGGILGGGQMGVTAGINAINNKAAEKYYSKTGAMLREAYGETIDSQLVENAMNADHSEAVQQIVNNASAKISSGETLTDAELGELFYATSGELITDTVNQMEEQQSSPQGQVERAISQVEETVDPVTMTEEDATAIEEIAAAISQEQQVEAEQAAAAPEGVLASQQEATAAELESAPVMDIPETVPAPQAATEPQNQEPAPTIEAETPEPPKMDPEKSRQAVEKYADTLDKFGKYAFTSMFDPEADAADTYISDMMKAYNAGKNGTEYSEQAYADITPAQSKAAYFAGQQDAEAANVVAVEKEPEYNNNEPNIEEAKKELKSAIRFPVQTKNEDALALALNSGELSMSNVTISGRVNGFTKVQQETLAREIIEAAGGNSANITVSVPYDGKFTVPNKSEALAKVLNRLKVKVNQEVEFTAKLDTLLKKAGRVATTKIDGTSYITDGIILIPTSERGAEYAATEYKAQATSLPSAVTSMINGDPVYLTGPVYEVQTQRGTDYRFTLPDGGKAYFDAKYVRYFSGASFSATENSGALRLLVAHNKDGSIAGYVLNIRNDTVKEQQVKPAKIKLYKPQEVAADELGAERGKTEQVHDGAAVLQPDGVRQGDSGLLDEVVPENVQPVREGAREGQSVPAHEAARQGADASGVRPSGSGPDSGSVGRADTGAGPVRAGAGDGGADVEGRGSAAEGDRRGDNAQSGTGTVQVEETSAEPTRSVAAKETARASTTEVGNFVIPESGLNLPRGEKARFKANLEAIRIAKECALQNRRATAEEQAALSKYVGWGGLSNVFSVNNSNWAREQKQLKALLTEEEYNRASASTTNAHYTSIDVVRAMYDGLARRGVSGGSLLEPSSGTGNFIGAMPENLRSAFRSVTMVELDPITAQIAALLYPDADVRASGFEDTSIPNGSMDLVIGNVPFGNFPVADSRYNRAITSRIHNYFIVRSLDLLKPGGTLCVLTSTGTMNASDDIGIRVRQAMADRADLAGAIRLPNTAFSDNAGTSVVTDILVFKKRAPGTPYRGQNFFDTERMYSREAGVGYYENEYFVEHPEMVLGTVAKGGLYGRDQWTLDPKPGKLTTQIAKAFDRITTDLSPSMSTMTTAQVQEENRKRSAGSGTRNISRNGKIIEVKPDGTEIENTTFAGTDKKTREKAALFTAALELRDTGRALLQMQLDGAPEAEKAQARAKLNSLYDNFVKEHGYLNERKNTDIISEDADYGFIRALESVKETSPAGSKRKTYEYSKADIFRVDTVSKSVPVTHADTAAEALSISMNLRARVDTAYIGSLLGISESEARSRLLDEGLAFAEPSGEIVPANIYLSGNVRAKLREAEFRAQRDSSFNRNVEALKKVVPADVAPEQIGVTVGAKWVPLKVYADFASSMIGADCIVTFNEDSQSYKVTVRGYSPKNVQLGIKGDRPLTFTDLYERMFVGKPTTLTQDGKVLVEATRRARARQTEIQQEFTKWLWSDESRRSSLGNLYNDMFNAYVDTVYTGEGVETYGIAAGYTLKPHQAKAVQRALQGGGNVGLFHATGAGKTLEMATIAIEEKRLGIVNKPLFVVPKNVLAQWPVEFRKFYPNAKILAADDSNFSTKNRQQFLNQIQTGEWDAVILSYDQFRTLPMSDEFHRQYMQEKLSALRAQLQRAKNSRGKSLSVKQIEKDVARAEAELKRLNDKARRDNSLESFDGLGFDGLFVDEAHNFKNLGFDTKLGQIVGLSTSDATRSNDLLEKVRYLQAHNGGRGIVFATATPIMNAINEMYTMQVYLQPDLLKSLDLMNFDNWAKQFCVMDTIDDTAADGSTPKQKAAMIQYQNVPELSSLFRQMADIERHPPVGKLPSVRGGGYEVIEIEPTKYQKWFMSKLPLLMKEKDANPLTVQGMGRNVSVSRALVDRTSGIEEGEKLAYCCNEVLKEYKATKDMKGTQIIFLDKGIPGGTYNGITYNYLIDRLVEEGIPREEIATIYEWETKKDELSEKVNNGDIRVVIGSYLKLGVGINLQTRLSAIHLLDIPYRPGDLEQAIGRGIRQGNMNEDVAIKAYVTKNTFDTKSWRTVLRKSRMIGQILEGGYDERTFDDSADVSTNAAEIAAIASGDTRLTDQLRLTSEVESLRALHNDWAQRVREAQEQIEPTRQSIARAQNAVDAAKVDSLKVQDMSGDNFRITINGKEFDKRKDAGELILSLRDKLLEQPSGTTQKVGSFSGFDLYMTYNNADTNAAGGVLIIRGEQDYPSAISESAVGTMTALTNTLSSIEGDIERMQRYAQAQQEKLNVLQETAASQFDRSEELARKERELADLEQDLEENPPVLIQSDPALDAEFGDAITTAAPVEEAETAANTGKSPTVRAMVDVARSVTPANTEGWTTSRVGQPQAARPLPDIIAQIRQDYGLTINVGGIRAKGVSGQFNSRDKGIRTRLANNLRTISHELGHYFDDKYDISANLSDTMKKELVDNMPEEFRSAYKDSELPGEGVAEFVRNYLRNSMEAAEKYPTFTPMFLNAMTGTDRAMFTALANDVNAYMSGDPGVSGVIRPMSKPAVDLKTRTQKTKEFLDLAYQRVVDNNYSIKRLSDAAGTNLPYIVATNAAYASARATQAVKGDLYDVNGEYVGPGFAKALQGIDLSNQQTVDDFNEYLIVKHAPERVDENGNMLDAFADPRYNNPEWMKKRQAELEKLHPEFKTTSERLYNFERQLLRTWVVDTGHLPPETADLWENRWQYYVPFFRVMDGSARGAGGAKRGFANQDAGIRSARGSGREIISPLDGIISQIVKYVNAGIRNNAMATITTAVEQNEVSSTLMEKWPTPLNVTKVDLSDTKALLNEMLEASDIEDEAKHQAQAVVGSIDDVLMQYGRGKAGGNVVYVMKNGKPEFWKINDPGLLESLTTMSMNQMSGVLDAVATITRFMTANITGNNILWSLFSNAPRDTQSLFLYSPTKNPLKIFGGIASAYLNKAQGGEADPIFLEYLAMGGGEAGYYSADRNMTKRAMQSLRKLQKKGVSVNPLDWISFVSDTIEMGPRFATYKYLRENGVSPQEAFYAAMDVTVNFRRGGRLSREINKLVPFFNAGIQGLDKFARWITAQDVLRSDRKKAAGGRMAAYFAVSLLLGALTYAVNNRDKEAEKNYQWLSSYTKNSFWLFPLGDGKYFAVPKPRELGVLSSFFEALLERTVGGNEHAFDDFSEYFFDNCAPKILDDLLQGDFHGALGQIGIIGVLHNMDTNKDFLGKPIESAGMQYFESKDRYTERTSKIAYWLGQSELAQKKNLSPAMIDYFFSNTLGGWWKAQKALLPVGEGAVDPTLGILNTYVKDDLYSTDLINRLYDEKDAAEKAKKSGEGDMDKAIKYKLYDKMTSFYSAFNKLNNELPSGAKKRENRRAVVQMVDEFLKAMEGDYTPAAQQAVFNVIRSEGETDLLPSVLHVYVKDEDGNQYMLTDEQYYNYQTDYLSVYWQYAGENLTSDLSDKKAAAVLKAAKEAAYEEATNRVLKANGWGQTKYASDYAGIETNDVIEYKARVDLANDDGSLTQAEIIGILEIMVGNGLPYDDAYKLFHNKYTSDKKNPYAAYAP